MEKVRNGVVEIVWDHEVQEVYGGEEGVAGLRLRAVRGAAIRDVPLSGVFIAIGHSPNTALFADQLQMVDGYIKTRGSGGTLFTATSVEGVFAAGDVQDHIYRQAITSAGSGCMAALDAQRYLEALPAA